MTLICRIDDLSLQLILLNWICLHFSFLIVLLDTMAEINQIPLKYIFYSKSLNLHVSKHSNRKLKCKQDEMLTQVKSSMLQIDKCRTLHPSSEMPKIFAFLESNIYASDTNCIPRPKKATFWIICL